MGYTSVRIYHIIEYILKRSLSVRTAVRATGVAVNGGTAVVSTCRHDSKHCSSSSSSHTFAAVMISRLLLLYVCTAPILRVYVCCHLIYSGSQFKFTYVQPVVDLSVYGTLGRKSGSVTRKEEHRQQWYLYVHTAR